MAALLQTAFQPPPSTAKPSSWTCNSKLNPLLPHILPYRRRRAPWQLQATGGVIDSSVTVKKSRKEPSKKKKNRKDKRAQEQQQQQLLEAVTKDGGGDGEDDDELPQVVFDRIIRRIVFTVGIPMTSGVGLLNVYDALKHGQGVVVPSWLPLLTILLSFGTSALGIAYGTLSASWDPEKEGSLLGLEEARKNWPELWKDEVDKK